MYYLHMEKREHPTDYSFECHALHIKANTHKMNLIYFHLFIYFLHGLPAAVLAWVHTPFSLY